MKLGDLVRIRSGGPLMTVNAIKGDQVVTIWATEDGRMSSGTFDVTNLTKLREPPVLSNPAFDRAVRVFDNT